jgi:acetyl esterase
MALHHQASSYIEKVSAIGQTPLAELSLEQIRQAYRDVRHLAGEPEGVARVKDLVIPGPGGNIPLRIYKGGKEDSLGVLMYFHGGGFIKGDLDTHDAVCRALANRAECLVAAVDYRLCPEHPHPAALEDCYAATLWMSENAQAVGGDGQRLAVAGDSAGGYMAAQVAIRAKEAKDLGLMFQVLVYPNLDLSMSQSSYDRFGAGFLMTAESLKWYIERYLPAGTDPKDPTVSPLFQENLAGLPSALIVGAEYDPLVDEGRSFAEHLKKSGVPVKYQCYPGAIHAFFQFGGIMDQGREAIDLVGAELKLAFGNRTYI